MTGRSHQSRNIVSVLVAALLCAAPAQGGEGDGAKGAGTRQQVAISGIISDAFDSGFRLNYGSGEISVDMTGWRRFVQRDRGEERLFDVGENVTVTGVVDDRLYRARRLEALSVFVRDRDSFFTVVPRHPAGAWSLRPMPESPLIGRDPTSIMLAGQVSAIAGDELSLDLGASVVSVDTAPMTYDPLDEIGRQRVREGDWVQVSGTLDESFFQDRKVGAVRITSVHRMEAEAL